MSIAIAEIRKGAKVKVTNRTVINGYYVDQIKVADLIKDKPYTISDFNIGDFQSSISIKEKPGIIFNSVNFETYD